MTAIEQRGMEQAEWPASEERESPAAQRAMSPKRPEIEQRGQGNTVETSETPPVYLLHGAFAVPDAAKGYSVIEVQQGMVTALDDESITITSPDGFTKTYPVDVNTPLVSPGTRVTAMQAAGGLVYLTEVGEPPADGARISALVPVVPLPR